MKYAPAGGQSVGQSVGRPRSVGRRPSVGQRRFYPVGRPVSAGRRRAGRRAANKTITCVCQAKAQPGLLRQGHGTAIIEMIPA